MTGAGPTATEAIDHLTALADAGLVERASRLAPAESGFLPVLPPLETLLPAPGLRRGSITSLTGPGATSLALALAARASHDGWVAAVGVPSLGLLWAAELGVALDRLVCVPEPGAQWPSVVAAFVDAFDVVITRGPRLHDRDARKLSAHVREHRSVLLTLGNGIGGDLELRGTDTRWYGVEDGHGHLAARTLTVSVSGRGAASRPRDTTLWLPDEHGRVSIVEEADVIPLRA